MIRVIIILFLVTTTASANSANCRYNMSADIVNNVMINKKENYTCKEEGSFLYQFVTKEEYSRTFTTVFFLLLEAL